MFKLNNEIQIPEIGLNEQSLGDALKENKIPREDIFLISKVNNCNQGYEKTMLDTWKAMEHLYKEGKVKSIGVCNFEISQLTYLLEHCEIKPMIDQVEHTPLMHDEKLISFCKENDIQIMAWGPLLRGNLENKKIEQIAEKYKNIDVFDFEIMKEDMEELNRMNENHRTSFDPLTFDF